MEKIIACLCLVTVMVFVGWSSHAQTCPPKAIYECKSLQGALFGTIEVDVIPTQCGGMSCCLPDVFPPFQLVALCKEKYPACMSCMACPTQIWNPASAFSSCVKNPGY
ncbi:MAG: hypothetical protein K4571_20580 [Deltaproteobacteria bacterium]